MQKENINKLNKEMHETKEIIYLNHGSKGTQLKISPLRRISPLKSTYTASENYKEILRKQIAQLIHSDLQEIAIVDSVTTALNSAIFGIPWAKGDEIVTTNIEHPTLYFILEHLSKFFRVKITKVNAGFGEEERALEKILDAINENTKLLAFSEISCITGALLPVGKISKEAKERLCPFILVDGAQSVGAYPVNVRNVDVDMYAFAGHKWQFGPMGTAALYVCRSALSQVLPIYVGDRSLEEGREKSETLSKDAKKFEFQLFDPNDLLEWSEGIRFLNKHGIGKIAKQIKKLSSYARGELSKFKAVKIITPENYHNLLHFKIDRVASEKVYAYLKKNGVVVCTVPDNKSIRLSFQFFNTFDEIERLLYLIKKFIYERNRR